MWRDNGGCTTLFCLKLSGRALVDKSQLKAAFEQAAESCVPVFGPLFFLRIVIYIYLYKYMFHGCVWVEASIML